MSKKEHFRLFRSTNINKKEKILDAEDFGNAGTSINQGRSFELFLFTILLFKTSSTDAIRHLLHFQNSTALKSTEKVNMVTGLWT